MDPGEKTLIESALKGDADAFESIIRERSRALFAVAFAVLQDAAEAEDVVQETFVRAWNKRLWLRDAEKFPAWLTTVARNRACDLLRKRRSVPLDEETPEPALQHSGELDGAEDSHARLRLALADLPEQHRTAITLRYLEGMDYEAIEQTMGLTNGALRGILGRALAAMRKAMKPRMEAYE